MLDITDTRRIEAAKERSARVKSPTQKQPQIVCFRAAARSAPQAGVMRIAWLAQVDDLEELSASWPAVARANENWRALEEFWRRMRRKEFWGLSSWPGLSDTTAYWSTLLGGIPGFFEPNPFALLGAHYPLGTDKAGFYSTAPLEKTLTELVDFALVERCMPRLTVGTAHVRSSQMRYLDSRETAISGPSRPGVGRAAAGLSGRSHRRRAYWDGGILSNTPAEAIFDDNPRRNSLIFAVHMWNPMASRTRNHLGGATPSKGHSIFEPRRQPDLEAAPGAQAAPCRLGAGQIHTGGKTR